MNLAYSLINISILISSLNNELENTSDLFNSTFLVKDIYNVKARIRR